MSPALLSEAALTWNAMEADAGSGGSLWLPPAGLTKMSSVNAVM